MSTETETCTVAITSTKFVHKLCELNKGKHNYKYPKELNRATLRHMVKFHEDAYWPENLSLFAVSCEHY